MCYREKKTKHSKLILELLSLAVVQYELFKCPRMVTKLTLQTAEEMMVTADYKDALQVDKLTYQNNFTTDSDLHYCEETQMAASTLVCRTHNTQLFTFS